MKTVFSNPIFYSDAHLRFLLGLSPRHVNVFTFRADVPGAETRHIPGPAHNCRDLAVIHAEDHRLGRAAYRIVVKPKRVSA